MAGVDGALSPSRLHLRTGFGIGFLVSTLILFTGTVASGFESGSAAVPVGDPVYRFLDHCVARGILPIWSTGVRPVSRLEVGRMLLQVATRFPALDDRVLGADLDYYLREFTWDIERLEPQTGTPERVARSIHYNPGAALKTPHRHLSVLRTDNFSFIFDPIGWARVDASEKKTIFRRATGIQFRGNFSRRLGYYFRFVDHVERGNEPYSNRDKLLDDRYGYVGPLQDGNQTYYDLTEAYINVGWRWFEVTFGKDRALWGSGCDDNLLLSGWGPSFDHLRIIVEPVRRIRFTYLVGRLQATGVPVDTMYRTDKGWVRIEPAPKWLAAHRLEYSPWEPVVFGVSEAIVWGERGLDPAYLNPINFYYSAEHNGNDQDNVLMSGDFRVRIARRGMVYGELLIDDMQLTALGKGDPSNKLGVLLGGWLADTGIDGLECGLEYTRLQPFIYSHFYPVNRYSNWTSSLGSELSPNSDRVRWRVSYRPRRSLELGVTVDHTRHGSVGGELNETIPPGSNTKIQFLDGESAEWNTVGTSLKWEPKTGFILQTGWLNGDNTTFLPDRYYFSVGYRY